MSGWDQAKVYYADQNLAPKNLGTSEESENSSNLGKSDIIKRFLHFFQSYNIGPVFPYRDQLKQNCTLKKYYIELKIEELIAFDELLANHLFPEPASTIALVFISFLFFFCFSLFLSFISQAEVAASQAAQTLGVEESIQVLLRTTQQPVPLRSLESNQMSHLVCVSGIIISTSSRWAKAKRLAIQCRGCKQIKYLDVPPGFKAVHIPNICSRDPGTTAEPCPKDPYVPLPEASMCVDQQTLKLQESPETVPTGEMPRNLLLTCDRNLVGKVVPGTRVTVIGTYTVFQTHNKKGGGNISIRSPYIHVLGLQGDSEGYGRNVDLFTPEEESQFLLLSQQPNLYQKIVNSIAPAIYGSDDIKKAVCCQLFGGSRKVLPDGVTLRGDINVLLLGDPGTAKSQVLKFVEKIAPVAVYTSGKGSSAAGLTASVIRDSNTGEFYLEGGAMVLADGGVVCIDEFDKMHLHDRVAIHEAMEQQTISVAKAGITTILNSRTAVLAAANPVFGRYDDLRSPGDNIDFQSTILSRFDLIFIVKDQRNEERDMSIAQHIMELQINRGNSTVLSSEIDLQFLKRYIAYAKAKCSPRLSAAASEVLKNHYVSVRSSVAQKNNTNVKSAIPITVRQLEAIIRLSESLAKITLSPVATAEHVNEAFRLFKISTLEAATTGIGASDNLSSSALTEVNTVEQLIKKKNPIGNYFNEKNTIAEFVRQGISEFSVRKAISIMVQRNELEYRNQRHQLLRKR